MLWVKHISVHVEEVNPDLLDNGIYRRSYYLIKTIISDVVDEGFKVYFHEEVRHR